MKVHCRVNNSPPLVPILRKMNPVHIVTSYFCEIQCIIINLPSNLDLPGGLFSSDFLTKFLYALT
jgi:hypothetical protein